MSSIKARELVVKKSKTTVIDKLSFTIKRGSITGLIGPSGSGKNTLMRSIVGASQHDTATANSLN